MFNLFKKKPKITTVVVWAEIIETSKYYIVNDFKTRKIIEKGRYRRMTVEEAKQELREYRDNINYIKEQQDDIEELRAILEKTTTRLSPTKTFNSSMSTDKFSDGIDRIMQIEKSKNEKLEKLLTKKFVIDEKIDKLEYPHRDVLFMRYSRGKSWEQIARDLNYSVRNIYEIHGNALLKYIEL